MRDRNGGYEFYLVEVGRLINYYQIERGAYMHAMLL